jgi:hypothetical protein
MKRRLSFGFVAINTVLFWLTMAIATVALWPIYFSTRLVILVVVTVLAGSLVAIIGAVYRHPSFVVMIASVATFLLIGVPLAVPAKVQFGVFPTLEGMVDLVAGVALGWKQLLTISLPVGSYEALLVPTFVLVLVLTVAGLSVALRARYGELAVIAPIVLFVTAIAFGPAFALWPFEASLGLLAAILMWLMWFRWYRRRASIRSLTAGAVGEDRTQAATRADTGFIGARTIVGAALVVAIAAGASVAAATALPPTADRTVLRTAIVQPFDPRDYPSPLSGFRRYWQPATTGDVIMTVDGLDDGQRIRIATLDTFDGVVYSVGSSEVSSESGKFTRVPFEFDQSNVSGEHFSITVLIGEYGEVWLPTVGLLESVDFAGERAPILRNSFYYNDTSGTAAVIGGLEPGDRYTLDAVLPAQPGDDELSRLEPGGASLPPLGEVPEELTAALDDYVSGVDGQGERLVAMLDGLREHGYISHGVDEDEPPSRSGHAADRIAQLFSDARMIGDAEQYAVTAALMARSLGFPARVVFGFVPEGSQVRGRDASAWIEVHTVQYGWVTIDPNPEIRPIPDAEPEDPAQVARPQTIVPPPVVESERFDRQSTPDTARDEQSSLDPFLAFLLTIARVLVWVAIAAAIALSPFIVIVAAKLRRRRLRRRASTTIERISGGWQEFEDSVVDHGLSPPPAATRSEVAATAGGAGSRVLAAVADRDLLTGRAAAGRRRPDLAGGRRFAPWPRCRAHPLAADQSEDLVAIVGWL